MQSRKTEFGEGAPCFGEALIYAGEKAPWEAADFFRAAAVTGGRGAFLCGGQEIPLEPGDVLILPPMTAGEIYPAKELRLGLACLRPDLLAPESTDLRSCAGFQGLFLPPEGEKPGKPALLRPGESAWAGIRYEMDALRRECQEQAEGCRTARAARGLTLLTLLCRQYPSGDPSAGQQPAGLSKALQWLEAHYTENFPLDRLAELAGTSPRHLDRLFERYCGMPPKKYVVRLRIDHACFLLRRTDKSITDIAFECGYTDSNYFARVFGKTCGVPPQQYRKENRNFFVE